MLVGVIDNLLNEDSSKKTSVCEDFFIDAPTPNMLLFFSIKLPDLVIDPITFIAHVWIARFNTSNTVMKKGLLHWHHTQHLNKYKPHIPHSFPQPSKT
jgi:hypothetical protein